MSLTRIYIVQAKGKDGVEDTVLVDAVTAAQALRFVAQTAFESRIASAKEVANYMAKGVKLLDAHLGTEKEEALVVEEKPSEQSSSAKHTAQGT